MQSLCSSFNIVSVPFYYRRHALAANYDSARISKQYLKTYICLVQ